MARSLTMDDPVIQWLDTAINVVVANGFAYAGYHVAVVVFASLMRHDEKRPPSLAVLAGAVAAYGGAYLVVRAMGIVP